MKNILKLLFGIGLFLVATSGNVKAQKILDVFEGHNTNVTGATVFIDAGPGFAKVTDIAVEQNISGAYLMIFAPKEKIIVGEGADASATNIVFVSHATNKFAAGDYLIFQNGFNGYELIQMDPISLTNHHLRSAVTTTQSVNQVVWWVGTPKQRWGTYGSGFANGITNVFGNRSAELYFKSGFPFAIRATNSSAASRTELYINGVRLGN